MTRSSVDYHGVCTGVCRLLIFSVAVLTVMKLSTLCRVVESHYNKACTGVVSIFINHFLWQCRLLWGLHWSSVDCHEACIGVVSLIISVH